MLQGLCEEGAAQYETRTKDFGKFFDIEYLEESGKFFDSEQSEEIEWFDSLIV